MIGFDGTETADVRPYEELQHVHDGVGISAQRVGELCIHAAFCIGRTRPIAAMLADTDDSDVRSTIMGRIDHCPSGSYSYALQRGGDPVEPDLPQAISVLEEEHGLASALWVTGGVPVLRADSRPLETRNRMTLCRCGHSAGKPLCDGTHRKIDFREESPTSKPAEPMSRSPRRKERLHEVVRRLRSRWTTANRYVGMAKCIEGATEHASGSP